MNVKAIDNRRNIINAKNASDAIQIATDHWIQTAGDAIKARGAFYVALSGGSTPKVIYQALSKSDQIDWSKVHLFWSDERAVSPDNPDSNYFMAMTAGFKDLPIPENQIHRMEAEVDVEHQAKKYDALISEKVPGAVFDLVMLGMGDDGHTASLFPQTHALHSGEQNAVANFIPQKKCWRMTLTFPCINRARNIVFYALGENKKKKLQEILLEKPSIDTHPAFGVGTESNKALWIVDQEI